MKKRLLHTSLLAVLALGSVSAHSFGDTAPTPPECHEMTYPGFSSAGRPTNLTYDVNGGVSVRFRTSSFSTLTAHLPLTIGDEPNPHFDRLYALLMKGFDNQRIAQLCVEPQPATSPEPRRLVSVSLNFADTTKVNVCDENDPNECAAVSGSRVLTRQ
jgi:hypothetical protein